MSVAGTIKMKKVYNTLRLILGDQLNINHSWFSKQDDSVLYALMEVRTETDYAWHHIQKVTAFFAAMENFYTELKAAGHAVTYLKLDDKNNEQDFGKNCSMLISKYSIKNFEYQLPDEYRLDAALYDYCNKLKIQYSVTDSEHFFTKRDDLKKFFSGKKSIIMENFYREMRRRHNIMVENGKPEGGQWNYDSENRKKLPKNHKPLPPYLLSNNVSTQYKRIEKAAIKTIGEIEPENLLWPVSRKQSLKLLDYFTENCLPLFGTFQDSMHTSEWSLYHSRLSFSLNTKMISPLEVIDAALKAWKKDRKNISLNQIEGFVRQILGWREFMRGIYWMNMPEFENNNFLNHRRQLPEWYWTGNTKMNCLKHCINQSLKHAYAHHIQRLMITGNFALLAGIHPKYTDEWYLGIYIDAIQWVELPNTRGMSQYADGGITATKPYTGSANYISKMSNYCDDCYYDKNKKTEDKACPFNSLYWNFHDRHREKLKDNPRLGMVYRLWDKIKNKADILNKADYYLNNLNNL